MFIFLLRLLECQKLIHISTVNVRSTSIKAHLNRMRISRAGSIFVIMGIHHGVTESNKIVSFFERVEQEQKNQADQRQLRRVWSFWIIQNSLNNRIDDLSQAD